MAIFYNQATLSYNGNTTNSNITTGELLEVLSASKTAVVDEYINGREVTYVINIVNSGNSAISGVTVTDNLGAYIFGTGTRVPLTYSEGSVRYFADGVLQPAPTVTTGAPLTFSGITVPANGIGTLVYSAVPNSFASPAVGGTITNTAVITGGGNSVTVTEDITAAQGPQLSINKSVSPAVVTDNDRLTYTFVIQNTGNTAITTADNAFITDTFDPVLSDLTVTFNGAVWTEGVNYTYDETTGLFTSLEEQITVPAATYSQDPVTGGWVIDPGVSTLVISGTV